jgi:hypothetical protein
MKRVSLRGGHNEIVEEAEAEDESLAIRISSRLTWIWEIERHITVETSNII